MAGVAEINTREILDSKRNPMMEVDIGAKTVRSGTPWHASKGEQEALELHGHDSDVRRKQVRVKGSSPSGP